MRCMEHSKPEPKLQPPGAGLPLYQRIALKLIIVGTQMEAMILMLSNGQSSDRKVDIAKVKPTDASGAASTQDILSQYKAFAPDLMARLDSGMKDRNSKTTHHHPWFGPFNTRQWYWLMAGHQGIHWQQLKQIKKKL